LTDQWQGFVDIPPAEFEQAYFDELERQAIAA
jgi:hypothetical protein